VKRAFILVLWPAGALCVAGFWCWSSLKVLSGALLSGSLPAILLASGRLCGLLAAYGVLVQALLIGRASWIERIFGHDRLARAHRANAFFVWPALLLHPVLLAWSCALQGGISIFAQLRDFLTWDGLPAGMAAWTLFAAGAILSSTPVRRRLPYERWHAAHLLLYPAAAAALAHQIESGGDFAAHPLVAKAWAALFILAFGTLLYNRALKPLLAWRRHRFAVERLVRETRDVVSVHIAGQGLEGLNAKDGQFVIVRFLAPDMLLEAHPFSLSKPPDGRSLRISVKRVGDFTAKVQTVPEGAAVIVEGPYGVLTAENCRAAKALLLAGGIGVTALRCLAERLARDGKDVVMLCASRKQEDIVFRDELASLASAGRLRVHFVLSADPLWQGEKGSIDAEKIRRLSPDWLEREAFLCGPPGMVLGLRRALKTLGVPGRRVHYELLPL